MSLSDASSSSVLVRFNEDLGVANSLLGSPRSPSPAESATGGSGEPPCSPSLAEGATSGSSEPDGDFCPFSLPPKDPIGVLCRYVGRGRGRALGVTGSGSSPTSIAASSSTIAFASVVRLSFGRGRGPASSSSRVFSPSLSSALEATAAPGFAPFLGFLTLGTCANRLG